MSLRESTHYTMLHQFTTFECAKNKLIVSSPLAKRFQFVNDLMRSVLRFTVHAKFPATTHTHADVAIPGHVRPGDRQWYARKPIYLVARWGCWARARARSRVRLINEHLFRTKRSSVQFPSDRNGILTHPAGRRTYYPHHRQQQPRHTQKRGHTC